jgi:HlyD family secretion protein
MNDEPSLFANSIESKRVSPSSDEETSTQAQKYTDSSFNTKIRNKPKSLPINLLYTSIGLGIAFLLFLAFRPTPIAVNVTKVRRGSLQVTVDEEGETRIRDRYVVSAPVAGRLARIRLNEGDRISQGSVIARIDPLPLDADVREAQARLREWQAERAGVATQRPKPEAFLQAEARIKAAEAVRQETQARVEQAQARLEQAKRDRQRSQQLYQDGAIARQTLEQDELEETIRARELEAVQRQVDIAIADVRAAEEALAILRAEQKDPDYLLDVMDARIASVEAELAKLADDAERTEIKAPLDGYVLRINQESAKYVEAGTPLLEIGNPQDLEIIVDLLSSDAVKVKPGAVMLIEHWGGEQTLVAQVRYLEPSAFTKVSALGVEEQRVNVIADFTDDFVPLGDRYRVETRTVVWSGENVLIVPLSALFRCDPGEQYPAEILPDGQNQGLPSLRQNQSVSDLWCTFVIEGDRAQKRQVTVSQRSNFEAVIQQGLEVGEQVILHPTEQIQAGKKVRVK